MWLILVAQDTEIVHCCDQVISVDRVHMVEFVVLFVPGSVMVTIQKNLSACSRIPKGQFLLNTRNIRIHVPSQFCVVLASTLFVGCNNTATMHVQAFIQDGLLAGKWVNNQSYIKQYVQHVACRGSGGMFPQEIFEI